MVRKNNCGEMNKKWRTVVPEGAENLGMQTEGNTVIGSSFTAVGTHILLDTSLREAPLTKARLPASVLLFY